MRLFQRIYDTLRGGPDGPPTLTALEAGRSIPVPVRTRMGTPADVALLLDNRAEDGGRGHAWRESLTELLAVLDQTETGPQRDKLAIELNLDLAGLDADEADRALHAALMQRLADNDAIAPQDFFK